MPVFLRTFGFSLGFTVLCLAIALVYGGPAGLGIAAILGVLEVSLSFDNAVVNAAVLVRMNEFWRRMFLTIGVLIAVFGMRLVFPLLIVGITAHLTPVAAVRLALAQGPSSDPRSYTSLLNDAHPAIAAFGGMFLLMLVCAYFFAERDIYWLGFLEKPLARMGSLQAMPTIVSGVVLYASAETCASSHRPTVLAAGLLGMLTFLAVDGLGELFNTEATEEVAEETAESARPPDPTGAHAVGRPVDGAQPTAGDRARTAGQVVLAGGKAGLALFLYLEVLDASFSFDGVIGAFAITSDPVIIALGLGIGAMFIRSLTLLLVREGTLSEYPYLEHGAHWAIAALAVLLLVSIEHHVPEAVTGLIGVGFIVAAFISSLVRNRREGPPAAVAGSGATVPAGRPTASAGTTG